MLIYQEGHEEAQEELPKKVKFFFSTAVQNWDAEFYVKVDDNIDIDLGRTSALFISINIEYLNFLALGLFMFTHWKSNHLLFFLLAEGLVGLLERRRGQDSAYIGCMKSGEVVAEVYASAIS